MKIYKKDIAIQQIEASIKLFFEDKNDYALHSLIMATQVMLEDIAIKQNKVTMKSIIKDKDLKGLLKKVREVSNFSKHSINDKNDYIDVSQDIKEINSFMMSYVVLYLFPNIYDDYKSDQMIFLVFYMLHNNEYQKLFKKPKWYSEEKKKEALKIGVPNLTKPYLYNLLYKNEP